MASSIPIPLRPAACFAANVWAGATHDPLWPRNRVQKWGRSSPLRCFALVQNQRPRETQPQCSVKLPFTDKVNGTVNRSVNHVFHAPLTFPHCNQRSRLFEAIEPPAIKRPRKGKTSIRKFVFFGKFAKPEGATGKPGSSLN